MNRELIICDIENFLKTLSPHKMKNVEETIEHDGKINVLNFYKMISGRVSVDSFSNPELYWIAKALFENSKNFKNPHFYFEEQEIKNYKYFQETCEEVKYPLIFKDVSKLADNQYLFPLSVKTIKSLKSAGILQVIPGLQRNGKKDKYGDLKTKVSKTSVRKIADLIDEGDFFYNGIRMNLMNDEDSFPPIYDEEKRTLKVRSGTIIVPDGNHRSIGCELAESHLDDCFGVFFTYLSEAETRKLLNQEWTVVPIPKKHKEAMKLTNENRILDSVIRSNDIEPLFVDGVVKTGDQLRSNDGFILYSELASAIKNYYNTDNLKTKYEQDQLRDWLISYINYLFKLLWDDFSNFKKVKRIKWSVHYLAWDYYILISSKIQNCQDWQEKLTNIIEKLKKDFSNKEIRSYFVTGNRRKIKEFFKGREEYFDV